MNSGRYILSQVIEMVERTTLSRLATRYGAEERVRHFKCRQQFICMVFAQMISRESLRDITTCLNARAETRYHLGFTEPVAKAILADANDQRDWRIWEDLAKSLMRKARPLYAGEDLLRKVRYCDTETTKELVFLTNNLEIPGENAMNRFG